MIIIPPTLLHVYEVEWQCVKAPMPNVSDVHEDYVLPPSTAAILQYKITLFFYAVVQMEPQLGTTDIQGIRSSINS